MKYVGGASQYFDTPDEACRETHRIGGYKTFPFYAAVFLHMYGPNNTLPMYACYVKLADGASGPTLWGTGVAPGGWYCPPDYKWNGKVCTNLVLDTDKNKGNVCSKFGNPINAGNGNKYERALDTADASGRLSFGRTYNSTGAEQGNRFLAAQSSSPGWSYAGEPTHGDPVASATQPPGWGLLDPAWTHSYSRYITVEYYTKRTTATVLRPDGKRLFFDVGTSTATTDADVSERLVPLRDANGVITGWRYFTDDNTVEVYDAQGRLNRIRHAEGYDQNLVYDDTPRLTRVTDSFGRSLEFGYDGRYRIASVRDPQAQTIGYGYDDQGKLATISYPDAASRTYLYDEPSLSPITGFSGLLTGIQDENAQRFATFAYDAQGRAIRTEHAEGAERISLAYTRDGAGSLTALKATDALGTTRDYRYTSILGLARTTSVSQPGGSGCNAASSAISYDANGNVSQRTDFVGKTTRYDQHDLTRNLELHRIEGYGSANAVNISTQWHPFWRLKTRVAEPKRITTWVYNGQPDPSDGGKTLRCAPEEAKVAGEPIAVVCKRIEQATSDETGAAGFTAAAVGAPRVWATTYNAYGQVLSEDGPRTDVADVTTYTYYTDTVFNTAGEGHTLGDLRKITNAAGQATKFKLYDRAGRLLQKLDHTGTQTTYRYTPRGWLASESVVTASANRLTTFSYDKVGQLTRVVAPNGYVTDYQYDAAHRLTGLADSLGNRIQYTLDAAGNRILEDVTDAQGVLARRTKRIFDQLGRLQNVKVQAP
jgi:YD repeat-containing protein